jgi:hypothetical protein
VNFGDHDAFAALWTLLLLHNILKMDHYCCYCCCFCLSNRISEVIAAEAVGLWVDCKFDSAAADDDARDAAAADDVVDDRHELKVAVMVAIVAEVVAVAVQVAMVFHLNPFGWLYAEMLMAKMRVT